MSFEGSCRYGAVRFSAPVPEQITRCNRNKDLDKISYNVRMNVDFDREAVTVIDLDGRHQW